jgi:hypothetical protein
MDPAKVQAIKDWPVPHSARALRGFLSLAGYYRKFINGYGFIAAPLTVLLKKEGFAWGEEAAVDTLKAAVTTGPVLAMPDFTKTFVVECDASSHGFEAVLIQDGHPIAFFSWAVAPATATMLHMSVSSSAWSTLSVPGGHTCGVAVSSSRRTIIA